MATPHRYTTRSIGSTSPDTIKPFDYHNLPPTRTPTKKSANAKPISQPVMAESDPYGRAPANVAPTGNSGRLFAQSSRHLPRESDLLHPSIAASDAVRRLERAQLKSNAQGRSPSVTSQPVRRRFEERQRPLVYGPTVGPTRRKDKPSNIDDDILLLIQLFIFFITTFAFIVIAQYSWSITLLWIIITASKIWATQDNVNLHQRWTIDLSTWKPDQDWYPIRTWQKLSPTTRANTKATILMLVRIAEYYFFLIIGVSFLTQLGRLFHDGHDEIGLTPRIIENFGSLDFMPGRNGARQAKMWWANRAFCGCLLWLFRVIKDSLLTLITSVWAAVSYPLKSSWTIVSHVLENTGEGWAMRRNTTNETDWRPYVPRNKINYDSVKFSNLVQGTDYDDD